MAYNPEEKQKIIDKICNHLVDKKGSLRSALLLEGMPDGKTFYSWINEDEDKLQQYARACELRADGIFEEMLDIADDGRNDYMTKTIGDGIDVEVLNQEHIQRSRLRIDARKWVLAKMNPKKYGDKLDIDHKISREQPLFGDD